MNGPYQLPPILNGTAENQLLQLRDYLVRLARDLPTEEQIAQATEKAVSQAKRSGPDAVQTAMSQAQNLKALIIKTADEVYHEMDRVVSSLSEVYVAISDFGEYTETVQTTIEQTAKETVESYNFTAAINAVASSVGDLQTQITKIDGEIRRGFVPDPDHAGEYIFGIAISQNIVTTGTTLQNADDGLLYEEMDLTKMKALGLYTATGWQFWLGDQKAGWFDSTDGMLHVPLIAVETSLKVGGDWIIENNNGFGIRYIGA